MGSKDAYVKQILPFLQRADELQKHEPIISYYCRLYAMDKGLQVPSKERSKEMSALLISLMNKLEKDKKTMTLSKESDVYDVEGFALNVFAKADKIDRAGMADINTAKTFYASSVFFEVLRQFGDLQPEIEQKQKYALWKAADIRKAISEGRKPAPGPPGSSEANPGLDDDADVMPGGNDPPNPSSKPLTHQSDASTFDQFLAATSSTIPPTSHSVGPSSVTPPSGYGTLTHSQSQHIDHSQQGYISQSFSAPPFYPSPPPDTQPQHSDAALNASLLSLPSPPNLLPDSGSFSFQPTPHSQTQSFHSSQSDGYLQDPAPAPAPLPAPVSLPAALPVQYSYHQEPPPSQYGYQPPPGRIVEAHKAARFAVSALAFDDVSTAIEHLRNSLNLLTRP